jgi:DNA-binding FrmR family transcriptional regulator
MGYQCQAMVPGAGADVRVRAIDAGQLFERVVDGARMIATYTFPPYARYLDGVRRVRAGMAGSTSGIARGYSARKESHLKRLRRIEGQVRGLQRMVEEDKYCIDILTQVSAATKALQSFSLELLDEHLAHCVVEAAQKGGPEAEDKVREASDAIARLVRS